MVLDPYIDSTSRRYQTGRAIRSTSKSADSKDSTVTVRHGPRRSTVGAQRFDGGVDVHRGRTALSWLYTGCQSKLGFSTLEPQHWRDVYWNREIPLKEGQLDLSMVPGNQQGFLHARPDRESNTLKDYTSSARRIMPRHDTWNLHICLHRGSM